MKRLEKINHILWFVIGILVLGFLSYAVYDAMKPKHYKFKKSGVLTGEELAKTKADSLTLPYIRISLPLKIVGTEYNFINLEYTEVGVKGPNPLSSYYSSPAHNFDPSYYRERNCANIFFFKDDYSDAHLLLDTKKKIILMEVPGKNDTLQNFILYGIVSEDTNGDSRLYNDDKLHIYLSDISGHGLRRITDEAIYLIDYKVVQEESKIYIIALNIPEDKESSREYWEEELYVYDVKKGEMSSPLRDHQFTSKTSEILWQ